MPNVVNLYVTNINHFLVKFKKMRVVLKRRVAFWQMRRFLDDAKFLRQPIIMAASGELTALVL